MGYRYYATVTFPAQARQIPRLAAWLRDNKWLNVEHGSETVRVSHAECSNGELEVTPVLDEFRVPYDHFHSDDCAGSPEPETHYVRFDAHGERTVRKISEEKHITASLARDLLALMESGDMGALKTRLHETIDAGPPESIDAIACDWIPDPATMPSDTRQERERG